jgi:hypothetical protein
MWPRPSVSSFNGKQDLRSYTASPQANFGRPSLECATERRSRFPTPKWRYAVVTSQFDQRHKNDGREPGSDAGMDDSHTALAARGRRHSVTDSGDVVIAKARNDSIELLRAIESNISKAAASAG